MDRINRYIWTHAQEEAYRHDAIMRLAVILRRPPDEVKREFLAWRGRTILSFAESISLCRLRAVEGLPMPWEVEE